MEEKQALLSVIGRCDAEAWQALKNLRNEPYFLSVVRILAAKQGELFEHDVAQALFEIRQLPQ